MKKSYFLRAGLLLLALTVLTAPVNRTDCKYITWYNTANQFYLVDTYSYSAAVTGTTGTPALPAVASTKGWWGYVVVGAGGGISGAPNGNMNGGYGGYLMGCVYLDSNETLYGLAGRAGSTATSRSSTDNAAYGGGAGHYGDGGSNPGVGGGGGASVLSKSSSATAAFAIAGGGGGGTNGGCAAWNSATRAGDGGNLGNATGTANGEGNDGNGNASQSGMSGASGSTGNSDDESGGGGGYKGGSKGNDPGLGYKKGGGGGSSYQGTPGKAMPTGHWAYNALSPYMTYAGSAANGWIYLVYMGDNDDPNTVITYTY